MIDRAVWLETLLGYEGTPFVHQGRVPGVAMDCPAPLIVGAWECGLKPKSFNVTGYGRSPDGHTLHGLCEEHMERLDSLAMALPGDAVLASFDGARAQHLGVLTDVTIGRMYWLQAEGFRHKCVKVTRLMFGRELQFVAAYRVPGVV